MLRALLRAVLSEALSQVRPGGGLPYRCHGRTLPDPPAPPAAAARPAPAVPVPQGLPHGVPHDGVAAMLSILSALQDGGRASLGELATATGLGLERLAGHALNLEDDGCLVFEREETLRLTSSGRTTLEQLGREGAREGAREGSGLYEPPEERP